MQRDCSSNPERPLGCVVAHGYGERMAHRRRRRPHHGIHLAHPHYLVWHQPADAFPHRRTGRTRRSDAVHQQPPVVLRANGARQDQVDQLAAWIAQETAADGDVPYNTPVVYGGDLNLVGYAQQLTTLLTGDVQDEATYGAGGPPDWDGTTGPMHFLATPTPPLLHMAQRSRRGLATGTAGLSAIQRCRNHR